MTARQASQLFVTADFGCQTGVTLVGVYAPLREDQNDNYSPSLPHSRRGIRHRAVGRAVRIGAIAGCAETHLDPEKDLEGQDGKVQETVVSIVEFGPGVSAPWHMHPGAQETLYALEGNFTVEVEGRGLAGMKLGEAFIIRPMCLTLPATTARKPPRKRSRCTAAAPRTSHLSCR